MLHHGPCHRPASSLRRTAAAVALLASCWAAGASAQSLSELYLTARGYDAAFLAAQAQAEATGYKAEQAKAANLPSVGLKGSINRNEFEPANKNLQLGNVGKYHFTNKTLALQARQSLFNKGVTTSIQQAEESLKVAAADLRAAESDLIVRLSQAYFDVLGARDALTTAQTNKKALAEQLASAKRNFEVGNATITDTREAQARFDLATAQEIAAENDLKVKSIALDQLVGQNNVQPLPLAAPASSPALNPATADEWVALTAESPIVQKATVALDVARIEAGKAQGEHLPTADLVGTLSRNEVDGSASAALASSTGNTASIGLEVNVPVFAGFATTNRIKETASLLTKSERDLDNARRSVALATRQAFFGVQSGQAQVKALEAAEASAKLALEATQLGYRVGVRVNKDVLDAQTALATTQRDLSKARYDVIVGTMKLRQLSGSLKAEDLDNLNKLLTR